jgi:hypothetical protein
MSYQHKYELKKLFELLCDCSGLIQALRITGLRVNTVASATRVVTTAT